MQDFLRKFDRTIWTRNLIIFAVASFLLRFGQGLLGGARINFFVDTLGLSSSQVLWLEGVRELPGLVLIFIAALTMLLPLTRRAAVSVLLMGIGYILFAFSGSYTALLTAVVIASIGFHMWTPLNSAIGMSLASKENAGRVLGLLSSVGSLASIIGMIAISVISGVFSSMPLGNYYIVGGIVIGIGALCIFLLPASVGETDVKPARIVIKKRYWLYYVLIFFAGARKLVLGSFVTLVLVQDFNLQVWHVSTLTLIAGVINLLLAPQLGALIDSLGERITTPISLGAMALACLGYAFVSNLWILLAFWFLIKLAQPLAMGLRTYVYRTAPPEELAPTLSAGVTFDHISSVSVPFLVGAVLPVIQYQGVFLVSAALILISIPFARALQVNAPPKPQPVPAAAD